jgi:hypothetical protein
MERIRAIRLPSYRSAPLRSTRPARNARKRANLIDFVGESFHPGLAGGEGEIRTPETLSNSIDGSLPSLSTLSGLRKSICVQEILFAKDSALPPDLSGYRIRELEATNLMNVEHQTKV